MGNINFWQGRDIRDPPEHITPTALGDFCPEHPVFSGMDEFGDAEPKNRWTDEWKKQGPGTELYSQLS